jgi:mono/diheme cytochrome c family protein
MKLPFLIAIVLIASLCTVGCQPEARQAKGFRLPPGDIAKGQAALVALNCHSCHTVQGVTLPEPISPGPYNVALGGEVLKVKTYGQLVTAIIHPSHDLAASFDAGKVEDALSPMPVYNHVLTEKQLIDMVAFLHSRYKLRELDYMYDYNL